VSDAALVDVFAAVTDRRCISRVAGCLSKATDLAWLELALTVLKGQDDANMRIPMLSHLEDITSHLADVLGGKNDAQPNVQYFLAKRLTPSAVGAPDASGRFMVQGDVKPGDPLVGMACWQDPSNSALLQCQFATPAPSR
jgi:hypothetical protein